MGKKFFGTLLVFIVLCSNVFAEYTRMEYFVTVEGSGTKDGSSWANAMTADAFATALSHESVLKAGVTFHLAAGTYHPKFDPFADENNGIADESIKKSYKAYFVQTPINIIGGYSPNPTNDEKPNPSYYSTIISGDMEGNDVLRDGTINNTEDNLYNLFIINLKEKAQCSFSGLTFTGTRSKRSGDDGVFKFGGFDNKIGAVLKLDRCTIKYVTGTFATPSIDYDEVIASNTTFENASSNFFYLNNSVINSCTFINCISSLSSYKLTVLNSTFYETPITFSVYNEVIFHNNTIVLENQNQGTTYRNMEISSFVETEAKLSMIGNIFDCPFIYHTNTDVPCVVDSRYNLYREVNDDFVKKLSSFDYVTTSINTIFEKSRDKVLLSNNGGYTNTIKIINDRLSESDNYRSIHFDRKVTNLFVDQRGVNRFDNTCMGAYEKRDTVYAGKITIKENDTFNGKKYEKYGIYDNVAVIMKNSVDLDSVVLYTVYVIPVDERTSFYVKTDGTGDGSSWEKAMSPTDFACRMYLSESIDTFYVAEGTYYPLQMQNYRSTGYSRSTGISRKYERSMPICLKGGYPKNITSLSQEPDPVKYKTILSVDFNNDNRFDYLSNNFLNTQDDGYEIFSYDPKKSGNSYIYGIVFDGGKSSRDGMNAQISINKNNAGDKSEFKFEQCEFRHAYNKSVYYVDDGTLIMDNCYFNQVVSPICNGVGSIFINACTFVDKGCFFNAMDGRTITISNCTMYDCEQVGLTMNSAPSSMIMFKNNTIYSKKNTTILSYDMQQNLYLIGNIIACNFNNENLESINSSYNVYLKPFDMVEDKIGTDLYTDDISFFLDNQLSKVDNVITPVLVMTSDTLPDGTSLRIPISVTELTDDQRKWNRYNMTSVGSYEAECQKDSSYLTVTDTIYAGDVYMGKRFVEVGLNYGIDTLHNTMGCDSLIYHPVYVLPERTIPTAFTPSDLNKKNDVFMQGHEVYIYDIYGTLICHSSNGWDGKLNDKMANAGIYVYAVKLYSGEIRKGTVELLISQ